MTKLPLRTLAIVGAIILVTGRLEAASSAPEPLMVTRGKLLVSKDFESAGDVDKESMGFRKQTQYQIADGHLNVIPL
jgi:hypothetical protein